MTRVRPETAADRMAVYAVHAAAFDTEAEAKLVDELRRRAQPLVSLVAEENGEIVGHILFSPVTLDSKPTLRLMGLAPMAILPTHQRQGIGAALVKAGIEACRTLGIDAVVVLGHPGYYPRFGFVPSTRHGFASEYEVPEEAFMALELTKDALRGAKGKAKYHSAFAGL